MQFYLILVFISIYLNAQDFDSELKLVNENIDFVRIEIAESKIKTILDKNPSYAHLYLSKISLKKADNNNASKNANLAVRIDEDFSPRFEELNSFRKKIQMGASSVKNKNYEGAFLIFSELFTQYPNYPEASYYYKQKNYKKDSKYFQNALDLYPDYPKARKALINAKTRI